ncbi:hypothetical protein [Marinobacter nitratireducens]|uniref:hypothetical protein n=1 Tax=Marinobacter nitratireducens TaxID=1137280 RepID=UPI0012375D88|nr:hypothetical protein [Marinobacter nitratireducens]
MVIFLYQALNCTGFRASLPLKGRATSFLFFAGTVNQRRSLQTTLRALVSAGKDTVAVATKSAMNTEEEGGQYVKLALRPVDLVLVLVLLIRRGPRLYRELKKLHPAALNWYFNCFCEAYIYLVYFYRLLRLAKPEYVVTANDHNVSNRCFLAVAHYLGIKTVYMQHASVSPLFPALSVDYAFLDGLYAFKMYQQCETNRHADAPYLHRETTVFFSGQKKPITRCRRSGEPVVGVALNLLDHQENAIAFIQSLVEAGLMVRLRWHPSLSERHVRAYLEAFENHDQVSISDARSESVSAFLSSVSCLVAGNSSIHLEAALAGVKPIYYEVTSSDIPDYYGFVRQGLASEASSTDQVVSIAKSDHDTYLPDPDAVRYYSSTYLTEWDGHEGELVADVLMRLESEQSIQCPQTRIGKYLSDGKIVGLE